MYLILISPDLLKDVLTQLQKWWYVIAICFVKGLNFKYSSIAIADKSSSWSVMQKLVIRYGKSKIQIDLFDEILNWGIVSRSTRIMRHGNILGICSREFNFCLKFAAPYHQTICIINHKASSGYSAVSIFWVCNTPASSRISVCVNFKPFCPISFKWYVRVHS